MCLLSTPSNVQPAAVAENASIRMIDRCVVGVLGAENANYVTVDGLARRMARALRTTLAPHGSRDAWPLVPHGSRAAHDSRAAWLSRRTMTGWVVTRTDPAAAEPRW